MCLRMVNNITENKTTTTELVDNRTCCLITTTEKKKEKRKKRGKSCSNKRGLKKKERKWKRSGGERKEGGGERRQRGKESVATFESGRSAVGVPAGRHARSRHDGTGHNGCSDRRSRTLDRVASRIVVTSWMERQS